MRVPFAVASAVLVLVGSASWSSACDSSSCALITRGMNGLENKGAIRLDLSWRYTDDAVRLEGGEEVPVVYRPKVSFENGSIWPAFHEELSGHNAFLQVDAAYGLTRSTTLLASIPLLADRSYAIAHTGVVDEYGTGGVGDGLIGVRQGLGRSGFVAGFAFKLPTGRHDIDGDFDGGILDPSLQPGSGSFDFVPSLLYGHSFGKISMAATASYQITTHNDLDYRFGNLAVVALSGSRPVVGRLSASLQLKLVSQTRSDFLGQVVPSTGGRFVYAAPGLRVRLPGQGSVYGVVQLLLDRYVNDMQLAPRAAFLLGFSKTL
jgi:hypothetical protein